MFGGNHRDRIAVIIASKGRPVDLGRWVAHARRQSLPPAVMIWAVTGADDLPDMDAIPVGEQPLVVVSPVGSCRQRNAGLDALAALPAERGGDAGLVAFFDDDYVPASRCLEGMARGFAAFPDAVGLTGLVLADGIASAGIPLEQARRLVDGWDAAPPAALRLGWSVGLYGCNMAFRAAAIGDVRFDEALPLYGWQEDVDFARQVMARAGGRIGRTNGFAGVHLGTKAGRSPGRRLGYSQVANIVYLWRKGTMPWWFALQRLARNVLANHLRALWSEAWVDRRGRVRGNWLALADWARGRLHPRRATEL